MIHPSLVATSLVRTGTRGSKRKRRLLAHARGQAIDAARASIFMSANDPIVVLDLDGYYLDANHAACRLLGYTLDELRTMTARQINHASEDVWRGLVDDLSRLGARTAETTYYARDGSAIPVEISACQTTYRGRPAIISVARNISQRKAVEARLLQHSARLASFASDAAERVRRVTDSMPSPSLDSLLPEFVDRARLLVPFSSVTVALCIPGTQWLAVRLTDEAGRRSGSGTLLVRTPASLEEQTATQAVLLPGASSLKNIQEPFRIDGNAPDKRGIALPLRVGNRLVGLLSIGRLEGPGFTRRDADVLLGLADQLAVVIDNSGLLDGIRAVAVSEERSRLGREMHDRVGQSISCASVFSNEAAEMLRLGLVDEATWAVSQATKAMGQVQADLRESIIAFRTVDVEPQQWAEGMQQFAHLYERQWGIRCDLRIGEGAAEACGAKGRVELGRILQEALTNVRKHADTERVAVSILLEDGVVTARVVDEGRGFNPADTRDGHYGLSTMRERAQCLGGELRIISGGRGTEVSGRLPAFCGA